MTNTRETKELAQLIRAQAADRQRGQKFRNATGAREEVAHLDASGTQLQYVEPGFAAIEDELAPDEPQMLSQSEARAAIVRTVVASLSAFERRVYELAYGPALMSSREVAHELEGAVSYKTVQRALDAIKNAVTAALDDEGRKAVTT